MRKSISLLVVEKVCKSHNDKNSNRQVSRTNELSKDMLDIKIEEVSGQSVSIDSNTINCVMDNHNGFNRKDFVTPMFKQSDHVDSPPNRMPYFVSPKKTSERLVKQQPTASFLMGQKEPYNSKEVETKKVHQI